MVESGNNYACVVGHILVGYEVYTYSNLSNSHTLTKRTRVLSFFVHLSRLLARRPALLCLGRPCTQRADAYSSSRATCCVFFRDEEQVGGLEIFLPQ